MSHPSGALIVLSLSEYYHIKGVGPFRSVSGPDGWGGFRPAMTQPGSKSGFTVICSP